MSQLRAVEGSAQHQQFQPVFQKPLSRGNDGSEKKRHGGASGGLQSFAAPQRDNNRQQLFGMRHGAGQAPQQQGHRFAKFAPHQESEEMLPQIHMHSNDAGRECRCRTRSCIDQGAVVGPGSREQGAAGFGLGAGDVSTDSFLADYLSTLDKQARARGRAGGHLLHVCNSSLAEQSGCRWHWRHARRQTHEPRKSARRHQRCYQKASDAFLQKAVSWQCRARLYSRSQEVVD